MTSFMLSLLFSLGCLWKGCRIYQVPCLGIRIRRRAYFEVIWVRNSRKSDVQLTMREGYITQIQLYCNNERMLLCFYGNCKAKSHRELIPRKPMDGEISVTGTARRLSKSQYFTRFIFRKLLEQKKIKVKSLNKVVHTVEMASKWIFITQQHPNVAHIPVELKDIQCGSSCQSV